MKYILTISITLILFNLNIASQNFTLSATVTDGETHQPLAGARVVLSVSKAETTTNEAGLFVIKNLTNTNFKISITYTGYQPLHQTMVITNNTEDIRFKLFRINSQINEVVVTGTGTPHALKETPIQTEVYSNKQITTTNYPGFMDAITSLSPSFSFQPTAMGEYLSVNGLSNDYVLILVDGKKISGDVSGNTDMGRLNMNNIQQIEVVKGASSALYGSDAMGAVINIITKKPTDKVCASTTNRLSAFGENSTANSVMLNLGKLRSTTTYDHKATDGYQLSKYEIVTVKNVKDTVATNKMPVNKSADYTISQKLAYDIIQNLEVYAMGSVYSKEIWRSRTAYTYNLGYDDVSWSTGVKWKANDNATFNLDYQSDEYKQTKFYTQKSGTYNMGDEELSKNQHYQNARLTSVYNIDNNQTLSTGAEWINDEMESVYLPKSVTTNHTGTKDITDLGVWAQHEYAIFKKLDLVTGARLSHHNAFGSKATFKGAIQYKPGNFRIRLNVAQGYKTPSLLELYYEYYVASKGSSVIGNSNLKPQESLYKGLSVEYGKRNFSVALTAYHNELSEMIYLKDITAQLTAAEKAEGIKSRKMYDNLGIAYTKGLDFVGNAKFNNGINIGGGVSYCLAKGKENSAAKTQRIEKMSELAATFHVGYERNWKWYILNMNLNSRYEGEKYYVDGGTSPYWMWDFNTAQQLMSMEHCNLTLGAGIRNLLNYTDDKPFGSNYGTLDPGRRFYVSLKADLKW